MDVDFPVDVVVTFHVQGGPEPADLIFLGSSVEDEVSGDVTGLRTVSYTHLTLPTIYSV